MVYHFKFENRKWHYYAHNKCDGKTWHVAVLEEPESNRPYWIIESDEFGCSDQRNYLDKAQTRALHIAMQNENI